MNKVDFKSVRNMTQKVVHKMGRVNSMYDFLQKRGPTDLKTSFLTIKVPRADLHSCFVLSKQLPQKLFDSVKTSQSEKGVRNMGTLRYRTSLRILDGGALSCGAAVCL
jgi:hypothetical protein